MSGRIRLFWLIFAVLFAALAGFACFYADLFGSIYNQPDGNPGDTVARFFNGLRNGDYAMAYSCLSDYATLGLEKEPETAEAKQLYNALRNSYSYSIEENSVVNGREATQNVRFHAINLKRTEDAATQLVNGILEQKVTTLPQSEVYAEDGGYLTSLTDSVYAEALEQVLQNAGTLCTDTELEIRLKYTDGAWKIVADRALMNALVGGEG